MTIPSRLVLAIVCGLAAHPAAAQEPPKPAAEAPTLWSRIGLSELPATLAEAAASGKRVLIGLGGSPG